MATSVPAVKKREEYVSQKLAAEYVQLSERRLRELAQLGRIARHRKIDPVTGKEATFYRTADLRRLRAEAPPPRISSAPIALPAAAGPAPPAQDAAELEPERPRRPDALWLTLEEAADFTGLPASHLKQLILDRELPARDVGVREGGRYRVCRAELEALRGILLASG